VEATPDLFKEEAELPEDGPFEEFGFFIKQ